MAEEVLTSEIDPLNDGSTPTNLYEINAYGTANMTLPDKLVTGDRLQFNITNADESTGYTGTIMSYMFPVDCTVKIYAQGARGSYGNLYTYGLTDTTRSGNGALVYGTFEFKKGDTVMILVGQHGRDAMTGTYSTKDCVTGAGGGGSFVAKIVDDTYAGTSYDFVGSSVNGSNTAFGGKKVVPLIIAAGGNGSRDNGYSGTGTIYGGLYTELPTSAPSLSSNSGGGFANARGTSSGNDSSYNYGLSFLNGGLGSQYYYTRKVYAEAGFGGGGANQDDGNGGGGGGYYGGIAGRSAYSYISPDAVDIGGTSDTNDGDGLVVFQILRAKTLNGMCKIDGTWKEISAGYTKVNGIWKEITDVKSKISGNWK